MTEYIRIGILATVVAFCWVGSLGFWMKMTEWLDPKLSDGQLTLLFGGGFIVTLTWAVILVAMALGI